MAFGVVSENMPGFFGNLFLNGKSIFFGLVARVINLTYQRQQNTTKTKSRERSVYKLSISIGFNKLGLTGLETNSDLNSFNSVT